MLQKILTFLILCLALAFTIKWFLNIFSKKQAEKGKCNSCQGACDIRDEKNIRKRK